MNWGWKIAIGYSLFVAMIVFMVILASTERFDLVTDAYYEKDLMHETHMQKIENTNALSSPLSIDYMKANDELKINFPEFFNPAEVSGTVFLYRPSDRNLDKLIRIELDSSLTQQISTNNLLSGLWRIKIDWVANSTQYFYEDNLFL